MILFKWLINFISNLNPNCLFTSSLNWYFYYCYIMVGWSFLFVSIIYLFKDVPGVIYVILLSTLFCFFTIVLVVYIYRKYGIFLSTFYSSSYNAKMSFFTSLIEIISITTRPVSTSARPVLVFTSFGLFISVIIVCILYFVFLIYFVTFGFMMFIEIGVILMQVWIFVEIIRVTIELVEKFQL